jgi:hypothetical protein
MNRHIVGTLLLGLAVAPVRSADWALVAGNIMTPWAAKVSPANALPEYPRPQMARPKWVNLNGLWDYAVCPAAAPAPDGFDGKILVPFPVESALSGVKKPLTNQQRLWYRRTFTPPKFKGTDHLLLHFGAVDWEAKVWVNGDFVGEHRGGYDAFTLDITGAVKPGRENQLVLAVFDATGGGQAAGKQNVNKITKPGGAAYTPSSGIWQTVWLETVPAAYIQELVITPDLDAGAVRLRVAAAGDSTPANVEVAVLDGKKTVARGTGRCNEELFLPIKNARLWTPDAPFLYGLKVKLGADEVASYFGMRKISLGKDEKGFTSMLLNNHPIFQAGPLDQGFWPDGIYAAPTDEALRFDIETMKRLGFNMVRKHVKIEPERWYYWCDKLGLLVWQDMPSGGGGRGGTSQKDGVSSDEKISQQFESELHQLVETHLNHPSIIMWVVFNESWGQYDTARLTKWVKDLDPTRLVDSASGWVDRHTGDVADRHSYPGPGNPDPESARASVLGEFGGIGLVTPDHTWIKSGWGYRQVNNQTDLTNLHVELWRGVWRLKEEKGLCAAVYTQLTDVETECNGVMTYDRKVIKVDAAKAAAAHRGEFAGLPVVTEPATAQNGK